MADALVNTLSALHRQLGTQGASTAIQKYKGETHKYGQFIREIEKYGTLTGMSESTFPLFAYQSAEGPVSDYISRTLKADPNISWANLKRELAARFADVTDAQHALHIMRKTRQGKDESVQVFAEKLLDLAEQAFPGEDLTQAPIERQLIDVFTDGVSSRAIARKLMRDSPTTFNAAVSTATSEQNLFKRFELRENAAYSRPKRVDQQGRMSDRQSDRDVPMEVNAYNETCGRCLKAGHQTDTCQNPLVCRKCKQPGHKKADCQKVDRCYKCNLPGHFARDCTQQGNC